MAKLFVTLTALLMIAGCSCNKEAATTEAPAEAAAEAPAMGEAPATGEAAVPMDAATAPSETNPETMGTDPMATATPAQ